jgi:hypothetical protein
MIAMQYAFFQKSPPVHRLKVINKKNLNVIHATIPFTITGAYIYSHFSLEGITILV